MSRTRNADRPSKSVWRFSSIGLSQSVWRLAAVFVSMAAFGSASLTAAESEQIPSALAPANYTEPGHSMYGEAFDEGPRRAASLLGTTGRVTFPITTTNPLVQQYFNQGIGQLHGFWYFEAERSFRHAATLDPDCAMNYFGMALANVNNEGRAKGLIGEAVKRKEKSSDREKRYIDAVDAWYKSEIGDDKKLKTRTQNYVDALEEIIYRYPDDLEAKAMLSLTLWQKRKDLGGISEMAVDALMNDVLAVDPYHPVHHYRVHLWDNEKAKLAVNSAERCGLSAPGIAHMWHMSGHTYSELNQYFDAAWHQEAATRTDHAYMIRDSIFPDRIHNFAHNDEWLVKNLQYLGRVHDAIALAKNAIELPQHPKMNPFPGNKSAHFGRLRLYQIYNQFELWDRLIADSQTQVLGPTSDETEQVKYFRNLGRAYFRRNDIANGRSQLMILERRLKRLKHDQDDAVDTAVAKAHYDGLDAKAVDAKRSEAEKPLADLKKALERAVDELQGYVLLAEGKKVPALDLFNKASDVDEAFLAEAEFLAGKQEESLKRLRDWVGRTKNQVRPLAALVEMLWRQEKKDEAKKSFEALRDISGVIDLDFPLFTRLEPIAIELGFGREWKKPKPIARNAAELPDLATLGPFLWQPKPASNWSLPDSNGGMHSLANYSGKPVIVIFYLGFGCLHCVDQLQAFAPKTKAFSDAGISLVAIGSDSIRDLKKSVDRYSSDGGFPFQLVSDESLVVFKQYQAYDDFERTPLHATYLIDGLGRIRWHDIGANPFMDVDFLLKESKRLLSPGNIELPQEIEPRDENQPADALFPRNVFPPTNTTPSKQPARRDVAITD